MLVKGATGEMSVVLDTPWRSRDIVVRIVDTQHWHVVILVAISWIWMGIKTIVDSKSVM